MRSSLFLLALLTAGAAAEPMVNSPGAGAGLRTLMEAVLAAPDDPVARERLRRAALGLATRSQTEVQLERRRLLDGNAETLTYLRIQAEQWDALLGESRRAGEAGLWALALDRAGEVLDENPLHGGGLAAAASARRGMARALDDGPPSSDRTAFLYRGLLAFSAGDDARARRMLSAVLGRAEPANELDDARVRDYLAVLTEAEDDGPAPPKRRRTALPRARTQAPPESAPPVTPEPEAEAELATQRAAAARRPLEAEAAALYDRGIAAYALGRNDEARSLWRAAVEADPEHAMARRALRHVEGLQEKAPR